jgi:hypothetical protein
MTVDLQVFYPDNPNPDGSVIRVRLFSPNGNSKSVSGNPKVEQLVAKLLKTDPNSSFFFPAEGSGLTKLVGQSRVDAYTLQARQAEIAQTVVRVESQILASQGSVSLPQSERLKSIDILLIAYDPDLRLWHLNLKLNMEDGNVGRVLLSLPVGG